MHSSVFFCFGGGGVGEGFPQLTFLLAYGLQFSSAYPQSPDFSWYLKELLLLSILKTPVKAHLISSSKRNCSFHALWIKHAWCLIQLIFITARDVVIALWELFSKATQLLGTWPDCSIFLLSHRLSLADHFQPAVELPLTAWVSLFSLLDCNILLFLAFFFWGVGTHLSFQLDFSSAVSKPICNWTNSLTYNFFRSLKIIFPGFEFMSSAYFSLSFWHQLHTLQLTVLPLHSVSISIQASVIPNSEVYGPRAESLWCSWQREIGINLPLVIQCGPVYVNTNITKELHNPDKQLF